MELRAARISERDQVLDLLALWYNDRQFFARYNQHDPAFRDDLCLVACADGRIVATVQIFPRAIRLAGAVVPMGGIGSVYTLTEYRQRGLAAALLQMAIQTMRQQGFELSLLFTDRTDYYTRFGWQCAERQFSPMFSLDALPATPAGMALSGFEPARDLVELERLYQAYSTRFTLTVDRDDAYWRGNLEYAGNPNEYIVLARGDTGALAYARAMRLLDYPMVTEYGYQPGAMDAMLTLFRHLGLIASGQSPSAADGSRFGPAALAPATPSSSGAFLVTHSAHDPALEQALREQGGALMHHGDRFYMWLVLDPQRIGQRLGVAAEQAQARFIELASSTESLYWTADRF